MFFYFDDELESTNITDYQHYDHEFNNTKYTMSDNVLNTSQEFKEIIKQRIT